MGIQLLITSSWRSSNRWRVQLYVAGVRDSTDLRTQREAKAWVSTRETELRARKDAEPAETHTVEKMLRRYLREVSSTKLGARPEGLRTEAFLRDFPALAASTLADIKTPDIAAWRDTRLNGFSGPDGSKKTAGINGIRLRDDPLGFLGQCPAITLLADPVPYWYAYLVEKDLIHYFMRAIQQNERTHGDTRRYRYRPANNAHCGYSAYLLVPAERKSGSRSPRCDQ